MEEEMEKVMTACMTCREIADRLKYLFGKTDGEFSPPALKEIYEMAAEAAENASFSESRATREATAKVIETYQRWRTAKGEFSRVGVECPYTVKEVGEALDTAVSVLRQTLDM